MFTYYENEKLYQIIVNKLVEEKLIERGAFLNKEAISDELLLKIKEIDLSNCQFLNVSLNGIEKLENLESFTFKGMSIFKLNSVINSDGRPLEDENGRLTCSEQWINDKIEDYNKTILKDITPLYKCKRLKKIVLANQIEIKHINLANFPLLKQLNLSGCSNLAVVSGLEEVLKGKDLSKLDFNFRDCQSLKSVENFGDVVNVLSLGGQCTNPIIKLPIRSYCNLVSNAKFVSDEERKQIEQNLIKSEAILWCENGLKGEKLALKSAGMKILMQRVDDILSGICSEYFSEFQNMKNIYIWITENTMYDKKLETEEENALANGKKMNISHLIRTSYGTLFRGKGVCVGISNLCALMFAEAGFTAKTAMCEACKFENDKHFKYSPNHQICYVENMQGQQYFFDPTWDTYAGRALRKKNKDKILYFLMNKQEATKRRTFMRLDGISDAPNLYIDANELPTLERCEQWIKENGIKEALSNSYNKTNGYEDEPIEVVEDANEYSSVEMPEYVDEDSMCYETQKGEERGM